MSQRLDVESDMAAKTVLCVNTTQFYTPQDDDVTNTDMTLLSFPMQQK